MTSSQRGRALHNQALEDTVSQLVVSSLGRKLESDDRDAPLFSSEAGFDSFSLMELVLRLEEAFDISIPDQDLDPEVFQSVTTIASYLRARLESGA
jgi:acyl carrier protein